MSPSLDALALAFAHASSMLFVVDASCEVRLACGAAPRVAAGASLASTIETRADPIAIVHRVLSTKAPECFEATVGAVCLQVDVSALDDGLALMIGTDITARKKTEERLRRSEAMLVDTQGVAHLGTWEWDVTEPTATWSAELYRIYDLTPEGYTPSYDEYLKKVHPDDRAHVQAATERVFREHVPYSHDERIYRPDGSIRHLHTWAFPVLDDQGKLAKLVGVCQDITDRKLAELAVAEQEKRLLQAHKLEAIGRLAGGIAHDFNNLLAIILARSALVHRRLPEGDPMRGSLDDIDGVAKRATGLIQQLLTFSRDQPIVRERIDLRRVIGDLAAIFGRALGDRVELVTKIEHGAPWVEGDRSQLDQVVMNLLVNARDAMPEGGTVTLEVAPANDDLPPDLDPSRSYVVIRVTDTGVGMDEAVQSRIFDPYFTTKKSGNGLGLSTTYGIVRQSGGAVKVRSAKGEGASFAIHLPRVDPPEPPPLTPTRGTVLVVEDQAPLRQLISMQLQDLGYRVLEAEGPERALAIAKESPFDLLVTDLIMPGMNGRELAREIRAAHAEARVLFVSGSTDDGIDREAPLLSKPFTSEALARAVRSAFGH